MANNPTDPTQAIRQKASAYDKVDEGMSCSQTSYKVAKKAFLYIGEQGGRYKAMFKLKDSLPEASDLAQSAPNNYEVGKYGWVTTRFSAAEPIPQDLWERWLEESYQLAAPKSKRKG